MLCRSWITLVSILTAARSYCLEVCHCCWDAEDCWWEALQCNDNRCDEKANNCELLSCKPIYLNLYMKCRVGETETVSK